VQVTVFTSITFHWLSFIKCSVYSEHEIQFMLSSNQTEHKTTLIPRTHKTQPIVFWSKINRLLVVKILWSDLFVRLTRSTLFLSLGCCTCYIEVKIAARHYALFVWYLMTGTTLSWHLLAANTFRYGPMDNTMTLLKHTNNQSLLLAYEQYQIQALHHNRKLSPEQSPGDTNPWFQAVINP